MCLSFFCVREKPVTNVLNPKQTRNNTVQKTELFSFTFAPQKTQSDDIIENTRALIMAAAVVATTPTMRGEKSHTASVKKSTTSAAGILALLEEPQDILKVHGLRMLNDHAMRTNWAEVASAIEIIEGMHEDEFFSHRELAALVASKVRSFSCRYRTFFVF